MPKVSSSPLARDAVMMPFPGLTHGGFSFYDDHQLTLLSRSTVLPGTARVDCHQQTSFSGEPMEEILSIHDRQLPL